MPPLLSYTALNALASNDTGHFVYLSAWQYVACMSILDQFSPLYYWMNDQAALDQAEQDDLDAQLGLVQDQLMTPITGLIMPICTGTLPPGTLLCDGSIYLRTDYPALYDAIEPGYRIDADSFAVPNLQDRFVMGAGPDHSAAATGGSFSLTQTIAQMPNHSHSTDPHTHSEIGAVNVVINGGLEAPASAATAFPTTTGLATVTVHDTGGGDAMNITNAFIALRYVVVAS
jgi:microcystin-dependent protein